MTKSEWGSCMCLGFTPIPIALLLKLTPERWLGKFGGPIDENKDFGDRKLLKFYNKHSKAKINVKNIFKSREKKVKDEDEFENENLLGKGNSADGSASASAELDDEKTRQAFMDQRDQGPTIRTSPQSHQNLTPALNRLTPSKPLDKDSGNYQRI